MGVGATGVLVGQLAVEEAASVVLLERSISYLSVMASGGLLFLLQEMAARGGVWDRLRSRRFQS